MQAQYAKHCSALPVLGIVMLLVLPLAANASGARQGVKAQPGEIVLLRDVSTRPAYRPAPPGLAVIVDPSPKRELSNLLGVQQSNGLDELSDDDYAAMGATSNVQFDAQRTTVEQVTERALGSAMGNTLGKNGAVSGQSLGAAIGGPMGAVGNATRGIGTQVTNALSQFPLGQSPGGP